MIDNRLRNRREAGFTLIELLVVVVVIGILIAIAIPLYLHYEQGAHDASAKSDLKTMRLEERDYNVNNPSSFASASQLYANNAQIRLSPNSIGTVLWANGDGFCVATLNTEGEQDTSSPAVQLGLPPYKVYFYDSTTARTTTNACSTDPTNHSALDGYFDSNGFHHL